MNFAFKLFITLLLIFFILISDVFAKNLYPPLPKNAPIEQKNVFLDNSTNSEYISLLFAGDIHFNWQIAELQKKEDLLFVVKDIEGLFRNVDFRCINLETVISNYSVPQKNKTYVFQTNSKNINTLKFLKIDLAILGNNHSMDLGQDGVIEMRNLLEEAKIARIGVGKNREEALETFIFKKDVIINNKNKTRNFAFISLAQAADKESFSGVNKFGVVRGIDKKELVKINSKLSTNTPLIINYHWGLEYYLKPIPLQIRTARALINEGVSVVIGHHPHIPQAFEIYKKGVIFYSLGNFLFGSTNDLQRDNIVVILDYYKKNNKLARLRIIPVTGRFISSGHKIRVLNNDEAIKFWNLYLAQIKELSPNTAEKIKLVGVVGVIDF